MHSWGAGGAGGRVDMVVVVVVMVEKEMVEVVGKVEVQRGEEEWMVVMLGTGSNATVQGVGVGG